MKSKVPPDQRKIIAVRLRQDLTVAARGERAEPRPQPIVICDYPPPWREMVKRILGLPHEGRGGRLYPGKTEKKIQPPLAIRSVSDSERPASRRSAWWSSIFQGFFALILLEAARESSASISCSS